MYELVIDNFAGGGGATSGIEEALGRCVDVAINHDKSAIAMHAMNHPRTIHYEEDVFAVEPEKVTGGHPVGLAWFSPDCKHFSKAKGDKPVEKSIRGLAWVAVRWAARVRPRVIILENVEEFVTWGPLIPKRDKATGRIIKKVAAQDEKGKEVTSYVVAEPGEVVPAIHQCMMPDPRRKGKTFRAFVKALRSLGYDVEWRELRACDFGAPTSRKRFFLVARCDGKAICWPEPTHCDPASHAARSGQRRPWRTAAEIIDWSIPCPSIFGRKRPLAENTMNRIARGLKRFVLDNPQPFIIQVNHAGNEFRGQAMNDPLSTITAKHGYGLVTPYVMNYKFKNEPESVQRPLSTVTSVAGHYVVTPYITRIGQTGFASDRLSYPVIDPLTTVVTKQEHLIVAPILAQYHGDRDGGVRGQQLDRPLLTQDASNRYALCAAFLAKHFGGGYTGSGADVVQPLPTVTTIDHNALVTSSIIKLRGTNTGHAVTEPLQTVTAGGLHLGEVRAFLIKYYGCGTGQGIDEPLHTVTGRDTFGLVTIQGEEYQIVDIGMRMLEPRELYAAHGFPSTYIIDRDREGRAISKEEQVAKCGNSVPPPLAAALVRANLPELCRQAA